MSSKFNGFTQDDIVKLSAGSVKTNGKTAIRSKPEIFASRGIRRMPEGKPLNIIKTSAAAPTKSDQNNVTLTDFNLDESMSKSIEEALFLKPKNEKALTQNHKTVPTLPPSNEESSPNDVSIDERERHENTKFDDSSILPSPSCKEESPFKGISLKDFESHRKIIQEANKQKKEMLYKAIEQHSEKTAAESRKIEEIKGELAKLDNDLAMDVAILRKQIEAACINYANIEKQYNRIEAQFLKAKLDLHNACEMKELLTEHLCTVIAHNEDSKAKKLTELMEKVGLSPSGEIDTLDDSVDK